MGKRSIIVMVALLSCAVASAKDFAALGMPFSFQNESRPLLRSNQTLKLTKAPSQTAGSPSDQVTPPGNEKFFYKCTAERNDGPFELGAHRPFELLEGGFVAGSAGQGCTLEVNFVFLDVQSRQRKTLTCGPSEMNSYTKSPLNCHPATSDMLSEVSKILAPYFKLPEARILAKIPKPSFFAGIDNGIKDALRDKFKSAGYNAVFGGYKNLDDEYYDLYIEQKNRDAVKARLKDPSGAN